MDWLLLEKDPVHTELVFFAKICDGFIRDLAAPFDNGIVLWAQFKEFCDIFVFDLFSFFQLHDRISQSA